MGNVGGSFGQSFAQTLIHGQALIAENQNRREALDLEKKRVGAQLTLHDVQTQMATRQLQDLVNRQQVQGDLQSRLSPKEFPPSELGPGGSEPAAPLTRTEAQLYGARLDPGDVIKNALMPTPEDQMNAFSKALGGGWGGGGAVPTAAPAAPAAPVQGAAPLSLGAPSGTSDIASSYMAPTIRMTPRGLEFGVTGQKVTTELKTKDIPDPSDPTRVLVLEKKYNPVTTQESPWMPTLSVPTQAIQDAAALVGTWGVDPKSPEGQNLARQAAVITQAGGSPENTSIALQILRQDYQDAHPRAAVPGSEITRARKQIQKEAASQAGSVADAQARGRLAVPEKLSQAERERVVGGLATIDAYNQIGTMFRPEYTGPARGGVVANLGAKLGLISPEEQKFRTEVMAANNSQIHAITGAVMSTNETERLKGQMPDLSLPPEQFVARLQQSKINAKVIEIRRRQVLQASGVKVDDLPPVTLTTEERRHTASPIGQDFSLGRIDADEAMKQLMGLSQYDERTARAFLKTLSKGAR